MKLKAIFAAIVAACSVVLAYFIRKSGRDSVLVDAERGAREYQEKGYEAAREGAIEELAAAKKEIDTENRNHFE